MLTAHKIALDLNNTQTTYMARAAGVARFAYNWALAEWNRQYEVWKADNSLPKPSQMSLRRQLNSVKHEQFPWMQEVTKRAPQLAIMQLGKAFENFFAKRAKYPSFRKKGQHDRFSLSNDQFSVEGKRIRIPKLGWARLREPLRFKGKIMSASVSRVADSWFVSITVAAEEHPHLLKAENQGAVGVDFGVHALATLSTGEAPVAGPKPHKALLWRLARYSRSLSRKKKGSRNRENARRKLARLHARIANIRADAMRKLTTELTRRFQVIGIEDLNVKGLLGNRRLSRAIADMNFHEFRRQLEYKAPMRGGVVAVADRWYAGSKLCSACGYKLESLPLSTRNCTCPARGVEHDRDLNAAKNLRNYAVSSMVSACGEESSGHYRKMVVKLASVKQEVNSRFVQQ